MHDIEPYYNWRHIYVSEEDQRSPFYNRHYSEFEFTSTVYNYYIIRNGMILAAARFT
jgi:hypothetical protein